MVSVRKKGGDSMRGAAEFKRLFEKYSDRPILLYGDP